METIKVILCFVALFWNGVGSCEDIIRMATTTSTENSGLLDVLNPVFEKQTGVRMDVIAVGTGKALRLGANGDVDVLLVHAPVAEKQFVKAGFGIDRSAVMHNDFVLIGPATDPAGVKSAISAAQALRAIAGNQSLFISRGDDSGTHKKELDLWQRTGIDPGGVWYLAVGQGMGTVLRISNDKQAYTLTDRGTFIAYQDKLDLEVLFQGDESLFNPYHAIAINPKRFPHVRYDLASEYIKFITGANAQALIDAYKKSGQQLFYPDINLAEQ